MDCGENELGSPMADSTPKAALAVPPAGNAEEPPLTEGEAGAVPALEEVWREAGRAEPGLSWSVLGARNCPLIDEEGGGAGKSAPSTSRLGTARWPSLRLAPLALPLLLLLLFRPRLRRLPALERPSSDPRSEEPMDSIRAAVGAPEPA